MAKRIYIQDIAAHVGEEVAIKLAFRTLS